jgi:hypothetical protein
MEQEALRMRTDITGYRWGWQAWQCTSWQKLDIKWRSEGEECVKLNISIRNALS